MGIVFFLASTAHSEGGEGCLTRVLQHLVDKSVEYVFDYNDISIKRIEGLFRKMEPEEKL